MRRLLRREAFGIWVALVVAIASFGITTPAFADRRDFELLNNTDQTIKELYVSPSKDDEWGDDILGDDVLPSGQTVTIRFDRYSSGKCYYDIKVVTSSGDEGVLNDTNLCEISYVTFS